MKNLRQWFATAGVWMLSGSVLLLASATLPWFQVPYYWDVANHLVLLSAKAELPYQIIATLFSILFFLAWIFQRINDKLAAILVAVGLVMLILFPYFAFVQDAEAGAHAAWFDQAHKNMVWRGGDLPVTLGAFDTLLEQAVLVSDFPYAFRTLPSPQHFTHSFGLSLLQDIAQWLGYSNAFTSLAGLGWLLALLGMFCALVSIIMSAIQPLGKLAEIAGTFSGLLLLCIAIALTPVYLAARSLDAAEMAARYGHYHEALTHLEQGGRWLPLFAEDTYYLAQHGLLATRLGQLDTPSARLYQARINKTEVSAIPLRHDLRALVTDTQIAPSVRREAARSLSQEGGLDINAGLLSQGLQTLSIAAQVLPTDPKLEYARQLIWLRQGNLAELKRSVQRMRQLYQTVRNPTGDAVVAIGFERLARATLAVGDVEQATDYAAMRGTPE